MADIFYKAKKFDIAIEELKKVEVRFITSQYVLDIEEKTFWRNERKSGNSMQEAGKLAVGDKARGRSERLHGARREDPEDKKVGTQKECATPDA